MSFASQYEHFSQKGQLQLFELVVVVRVVFLTVKSVDYVLPRNKEALEHIKNGGGHTRDPHSLVIWKSIFIPCQRQCLKVSDMQGVLLPPDEENCSSDQFIRIQCILYDQFIRILCIVYNVYIVYSIHMSDHQ